MANQNIRGHFPEALKRDGFGEEVTFVFRRWKNAETHDVRVHLTWWDLFTMLEQIREAINYRREYLNRLERAFDE